MKESQRRSFIWHGSEQDNKLISMTLKKRARALADFAIKHNIGYVSITTIDTDYTRICAKPDSKSNKYIVDAYAFIKENATNE